MIPHDKMTSLDGTWRLYIAENRFCKAFAKELCDEDSLSRLKIKPTDGSVPGNFELDMLRDGLIDDPFFGTNVLELQKLENRHLWYVRNFDYKKEDGEDCTPTLRFVKLLVLAKSTVIVAVWPFSTTSFEASFKS